MSANARVIEIVEELKKLGKVRDYKHFAETIGVSKSFLSDLKAERKKVSVEVLSSMKNKYPEVDLTYIVTGTRSTTQSPNAPLSEDAGTLVFIDKMQGMAEEIGALKYQLKEAQATIKELKGISETSGSDGDWQVKTVGDVRPDVNAPSTKHSSPL